MKVYSITVTTLDEGNMDSPTTEVFADKEKARETFANEIAHQISIIEQRGDSDDFIIDFNPEEDKEALESNNCWEAYLNGNSSDCDIIVTFKEHII